MQHYILFYNHTSGMELYNKLKERGIRSIIAPTPRSLSKCCGISLLVEEDKLHIIRDVIQENDIEIIDIAKVDDAPDIHRDKYC